jgi:hypothetical protein
MVSRIRDKCAEARMIWQWPKGTSFCLYVRPFRLTPDFPMDPGLPLSAVEHLRPMMIRDANAGWLSRGVFEQQLVNGVLTAMPCVAIKPPTGVTWRAPIDGAVELTFSDRTWWKRFKYLARNATLIIALPGAGGGVSEECQWVRAYPELAQKTIWLMPPTEADADICNWWTLCTRALVAAHRIQLPAYHEAGALFRIDPAGIPYNILSFESLFRVADRTHQYVRHMTGDPRCVAIGAPNRSKWWIAKRSLRTRARPRRH